MPQNTEENEHKTDQKQEDWETMGKDKGVLRNQCPKNTEENEHRTDQKKEGWETMDKNKRFFLYDPKRRLKEQGKWFWVMSMMRRLHFLHFLLMSLASPHNEKRTIAKIAQNTKFRGTPVLLAS